MANTVEQRKRKRIRVACEPCRERKRRCNGINPCITCNNWDIFRASGHYHRPSTHIVEPDKFIIGLSKSPFVRNIGLKIDQANAPKLGLFGWNIGSRQLRSGPEPCSPLSIVNITSEGDIKELANFYFSKVHPCYGFIDRHTYFERLAARWRMTLTDNLYDSVLGGVAALGSLFSQRNPTITELHLASGLHLEPSSDTVFPRSASCDPDIRRRLVGVAQHLNMVSLQSIFAYPSSPKPGDYTTELLNLLPASASLDPGKAGDDKDLELTLSQILNGIHTQPPSVLAQCNLVLCILRRLGTWSFNNSSAVTEQILTLLKNGLHSARILVRDCCPWHHVANVPFHTICILLVMDTRASLAVLPDAMRTLELVASIYDTETMKLAYSTACLLVLLYQQRRREDIKVFSDALNMQDQQGEIMTPPQQLNPTSEEFSWLEGLVADMPGLQEFDIEQFLRTDIINM
ncbi:hypothetical protein B0O99DRAFT_650017 [Bisporella sp. PMI_857]|nr:hypothetical protein B0O99DRAFT_650017 [Bisporella sp. PMI_857]